MCVCRLCFFASLTEFCVEILTIEDTNSPGYYQRLNHHHSPVAIRTSPRLPNDIRELLSTIADNNRMIRETERARRKHGQFASPLRCRICRNQVDDQGYAQKNLTSLTARSLVGIVPQHERQGR